MEELNGKTLYIAHDGNPMTFLNSGETTESTIKQNGNDLEIINATAAGDIKVNAKVSVDLIVDGTDEINITAGHVLIKSTAALEFGGTGRSIVDNGTDVSFLNSTNDGDILLTASGTTADIILDSTRKVELDGGTSVSLDIAGTPVMTVEAALIDIPSAELRIYNNKLTIRGGAGGGNVTVDYVGGDAELETSEAGKTVNLRGPAGCRFYAGATNSMITAATGITWITNNSRDIGTAGSMTRSIYMATNLILGAAANYLTGSGGTDVSLINGTNDGDILITASGTTADIILDSTRLIELDAGVNAEVHIAGVARVKTIANAHTIQAAATDHFVYLDQYSTTVGETAHLYFRKSASATMETVSETASGDVLMKIAAQGVTSGSSFQTGALITAQQVGAAGANFVPTDLNFATWTDTSGDTWFTIRSDGDIEIRAGTELEFWDSGETKMTALNQNGDDFQLVNATNDGDILVTASGTTADIILDSTRLVELDGGTTISLAIAGTDEATITAGHILVKSTTPLEFGATSRHINDDGTHISMVNTTVGGNIYLDAKSTSELKIDGVTFLNIQSGSFRFQGGNEIRAYRTGNTNYASITKGATNDLTILEATGDIAINTTAANGDILLTASGTTADIILDSTRKVELDGGTSVSLDIAGTPVMTVAAALVKSVQEVEIENSADTPLLLLDQDHATSEFIKFEGTVQADDSGNISTQNGDGAVTGPKDANAADGWTFSRMVKVDEGGTEYWVPLYVNDPAA